MYDSKKAGSVTVSHLRFGPEPIRSSYLIERANFIGCHQFAFLERMDVLSRADTEATFLLNAPFGPNEVWDHLPRKAQQHIIEKKLRVFVIDAGGRTFQWPSAQPPLDHREALWNFGCTAASLGFRDG